MSSTLEHVGQRTGRNYPAQPQWSCSAPALTLPAIAGVTLVLGAGYVIVNAIIDVLQAAADPRIAL